MSGAAAASASLQERGTMEYYGAAQRRQMRNVETFRATLDRVDRPLLDTPRRGS